MAAAARAASAASPVWDVSSSTLLWVQPAGPAVHRYDPASGRDDAISLPQHVAHAHPRVRGGLVVHLLDGVAVLDPSGDRRWLVYWAREAARAGAAAVGPSGELWVGNGDWLARVEPDGAATVVLRDVAIDGLAYDTEAGRLYLAGAGRIEVLEPGAAGPQALCDVGSRPGGLCVDAEGAVWVAVPGAVRRYLPAGVLDDEVLVRGAPPTGCAFGGPRLTDLYVTTADGSLLVLAGAGTGAPTPIFAG
ncbi:MAG: SMP-30/gluconolactonase/LRE family protein [Pseudonocardiaceae bacterium]|nr:SMP-30/gluconolactonase/LRE family protein [Pseudonocardiaceae bacterium]